MAEWQFRTKKIGDKTKDVPLDDFFTKSSEASSFVRESVQNSLDGRVDQESPVKVKISINTDTSKLNSNQVLKWFKPEEIEHFKSEGSGLINLPNFNDDCSYLVYEDFNTFGLNGDIWQDSKIKDKPNHFYGFYRQEGQTEKITGNGSAGVGKIVFPMASKVRTIFGFTTRTEDNKTYLMGISSLSYHKVNNKVFTGDGYFANSLLNDASSISVPSNIDSNEFKDFPIPIDDTEILEDFRKEFRLKRKGESGLSIVVPWLDDSINYDSLLKSVIEEYYAAVMSGALVIEIFKDDKKNQVIDVETITNLASQNSNIDNELLLKILLAEEFYSAPGINNNPGKDDSIELQVIAKVNHRWTNKDTSERLLNDEIISEIKENLESKNSVARIKIPVTIHKEDHSKDVSFFHILIQRADHQVKPTFVRDQLIIPEASNKKLSGYLVMVFLQDKAIDNFARSAENPSHRSWSSKVKKFKENRYRSGEDLLTFIKTAPQQIVQKLVSEDEKPDTNLLSDIFNIKLEGDDPSKKKKKKKKKDYGNDNDDYDFEPRKIYFTENQIDAGFKVSGGEDLKTNRKFNIRAGYRISGSSKIKWHEKDFKFEDLEIVHENVSELSCSGNKISFIANSKSFSVQVSGFDTNRDLIVFPISQKLENEDA